METQWVGVFRENPAAQKEKKGGGRRNTCADVYLNVQGRVHHSTSSASPRGVTTGC